MREAAAEAAAAALAAVTASVRDCVPRPGAFGGLERVGQRCTGALLVPEGEVATQSLQQSVFTHTLSCHKFRATSFEQLDLHENRCLWCVGVQIFRNHDGGSVPCSSSFWTHRVGIPRCGCR